MLMFPILLLLFRVSANPVPSSSTDLVTDGDSPSVDSDNLAIAGCPGDTVSTQISDGGNEGDLNIFRRNTKKSCPVTAGFSFEWGTPRRVQWKAPSVLPQIAPADYGDYGGDNEEYCRNPVKQYQVTCGGPEVWYKTQIGYVLNCVVGKFLFISPAIRSRTELMVILGFVDRIPRRNPWPEATVVSQFCCHKALGEVS